jgi:hypothetical protein
MSAPLRQHQALHRSVLYKSSSQLQRAIEGLEPRVLMSADVLQYHNDALSTGQQLAETVLTPSNVNPSDFGKLFTATLDGQVYAQPLVKTNVNITRGPLQGIHNVVYAATQHDSLYAIDANTGTILWQDSFLQINDPRVTTINSPVPTAGVTTYPAVSGDNALVNTADVGPELGILATPVIDATNNRIYVVTNSQEFRNGSTPTATFTSGTTDIHFVQRLWAINLSDGSVAIAPTNIAVEPSSGGQIIGDVILNPTGTNTVPSFSSFTGYEYVAGPFIKGTGDNGANDSAPRDGWIAYSGSAQTHPWTNAQTPMQAGYVVFNALLQMGRCAVSLIGGNIYLGYASHGDKGPYYGYLLGFNATTLANNACFVTAPTFEPLSTVSGNNGSSDAQAGLWMSGDEITTDGTYLYFTTGNGAFNVASTNFSAGYTTADTGNTVQLPLDNDYGDCVMKVAFDASATQSGTPDGTYNPDNYNPNGFGLKVVDYFAPSNALYLNFKDEDIGSGGISLLPNNVTSTVPNHVGDHMLITGGKEGRIYLLDRENLGGYNTSYNSTRDANGNPTISSDPVTFDRVLGEYSVNGIDVQTNQFYSTASFYQNGGNPLFFVGLGKKPNWQFNVGSFQASSSPPPPGSASTNTPVATTTMTTFGSRGTTSSISANGDSNAVVWNLNVAQASTDDLLAYTTSLGTPIYDSQTNAARDQLTGGVTNATGVKFSLPTIYNGMAYVGTGGGSGTGGHIMGTLVGYGLLNSYLASDPSFFGAPTGLAATPNSATSVHLSWTRQSTVETNMRVDRSTNGTAWTTLAYLPNGSTSYDDATVTPGTQYFYRVAGISGSNVTAFTESAYYDSTGGAHTYGVRLDAGGTNLQLFVDAPLSGGATFTFPSSTFASITINTTNSGGGTGSEAATVDFTNGNPVPSGGISFSGGTGANDSLTIAGGSSADSVSIGASTVSVNGSANVSYSAVETLTINTDSGNDTLTQTATPTAANVTFNGGTGSDTLNVNGGTFTFSADPAVGTSSLTVNDNASVVFTGNNSTNAAVRNLAALVVTAGHAATINTSTSFVAHPVVLDVPSLTLSGAGALNLTNNELITNGNAALIRTMLGTGKPIVTTASGGALGYKDLTASAEEVRFVLLGDSDLDTHVNVSDLANLAGNFGATTGATWIQGDFDNNGNVNVADLADLAGNFGNTLGGGSAVVAPTASAKTAATVGTAASAANAVFPSLRGTNFSDSPIAAADDTAVARWIFDAGDDQKDRVNIVVASR